MSAPTGNEAVDVALQALEPLVLQAQLKRAQRRIQAQYDAYLDAGGLQAARAFVSRVNLTCADRRFDSTRPEQERRQP